MKKVICGVLAVLLALSLAGCGTDPGEPDDRRTNESRRESATNPGGKESGPSQDPSGSGKGMEMVVTWANWETFIEFYKVEDHSRANASEKMVDYTFAVRAKEGYELTKLSAAVDAVVYYRCGNADMKEHVEQNIMLTMEEPTASIRFTADDLIDYNGRIVESVFYDIVTISGRVIRK
jgi:hypothetical protein